MTYQATVYRALIASPSDVADERKAIPEVIHSWNSVHSSNFKAMIIPVLWETDAVPEMGDSPQAILNKQLVKNCDLLIGVFWTRLGTRTPKAESGTVEEIREFISAGKPVLLYFSSALVAPKNVNQGQYKRLLKFKEQCQNQGLVFDYESVDQLRDALQGHLTRTISRAHQAENGSPDNATPTEGDASRSALIAFKVQFEAFLRRLDAAWKAERDSEPNNTDEGKLILEGAASDLLDFRAQIERAEGSELPQVLDDAARQLTVLQRHQTYADGGTSFNAFWQEGNEVLSLLRRVPVEIDKAIQ